MKKFVLPIVFLATTFLSVFMANVFAEDQETSTTELPKIVYIEGTVSVVPPSQSAVPAEKGMELKEDTVIKTDEQSYCDISFDKENKNIISVGPNSELKIGKDFKQVSISKGRVFSELKGLKPGSTFEVVTPQAIAGVRGTAWESVIDAISKFNVKVSTIYVKGIDKKGSMTGKNDISQGHSVVVDSSGWLGELQDLTKEDEERMDTWSNRIAMSLKSASSKGNCNSLIDGYDGASANLFGQVMDCEVGKDSAAFASASEGIALLQGETGQGITGSDITQTTFASSPAESPVETQVSTPTVTQVSTPTVTQPPPKPVIDVTRPFRP